MAARVVRVGMANSLFQQVEVLKRNRHKRHRAGQFLVEGVQAINQAVAHGWTFTMLVYASRSAQPLSAWATEVLEEAKAPLHVALVPSLMAQLSEKEEPSELVAVLRMPDDDLDRIKPGRRGRRPLLVVVFDRPVSPGNLGSLIRSCDALGADGLVVTGHGADVYAPETIRASMGSLFALPVVRQESARQVSEWLEALSGRGDAGGRVQVVGASGEAPQGMDAVDLTGPTVLVLGNETHGLSVAYRQWCDVLACIPMYGAADSLNVACAGSIALYEIDRQRRARWE